MQDRLVLDSSVIVALFFREPYSEWAEEVVRGAKELFTVDIAVAEVANAAWKRVMFFGENPDAAKETLTNAINFVRDVCHVSRLVELCQNAFELALEAKISVYDALFLALALKLDCRLATLDRKLVSRLKETKYYELLLHPYQHHLVHKTQ